MSSTFRATIYRADSVTKPTLRIGTLDKNTRKVFLPASVMEGKGTFQVFRQRVHHFGRLMMRFAIPRKGEYPCCSRITAVIYGAGQR
jgi:hypothetical protein